MILSPIAAREYIYHFFRNTCCNTDITSPFLWQIDIQKYISTAIHALSQRSWSIIRQISENIFDLYCRILGRRRDFHLTAHRTPVIVYNEEVRAMINKIIADNGLEKIANAWWALNKKKGEHNINKALVNHLLEGTCYGTAMNFFELLKNHPSLSFRELANRLLVKNRLKYQIFHLFYTFFYNNQEKKYICWVNPKSAMKRLQSLFPISPPFRNRSGRIPLATLELSDLGDFMRNLQPLEEWRNSREIALCTFSRKKGPWHAALIYYDTPLRKYMYTDLNLGVYSGTNRRKFQESLTNLLTSSYYTDKYSHIEWKGYQI